MGKFFTSRKDFIKNVSLGITALSLPVSPKSQLSKNQIANDMRQTTADIIVEKLIDWNVEFIFGIVGDGINYIIEALRKKQSQISFITVRHEEAAAFMASGYAKYTGKLGACIATTGPGAVHLMNGLYDAAMESAPVIAITGLPYHDLIGMDFTQSVDTVALMKDVAIFNTAITGPQHALTVVDHACRIALSTPGVVHLTVSKDIQNVALEKDERPKENKNLFGSSFSLPRTDVPEKWQIEQVANVLNHSKKTAILVGRGALAAQMEVEQLAAKLKAPVAKALLGKAVIADNSPYTTGGIGHLGTLPSKKIMHSCDALLILGSNMPHLEYYPKPGQAKCIQVDRDVKRLGLRCAIDIGLHGDVKATLQALIPLLEQNTDSSFLNDAQSQMKEWENKLKKIEGQQAYPIKPQLLVARVNGFLKDDAIIAIDTGAHTVFTARHLKIKPNQMLAVSGNLATMAPGLPYVIAAQTAFKTRQCVAFVGDGGFTMLIGELATAVRYKLPIKVIVFKNNALAMDRFEQEEMGNKDYGIDLQPVDFVKIAQGFGAEGYKCETISDLDTKLEAAFASPNPCVVEVMVDPDENPAPPDKV